MDEYYWPVRNVAEYAYCPRLFYLMEIEGVRLANADTLEGLHVHQHVDSPSLSIDSQRNIRRKKDECNRLKSQEKNELVESDAESDSVFESKLLTVRSLTLSDDELRLTATLDLAEIEGSKALPVEYRKGAPRQIETVDCDDGWSLTDDSPPPKYEPWDTDRIQIVLQSILLEKAGYLVSEGIVYYAKIKRRLHFSITEEMRTEALTVLDSAKKLAASSRPAPLLNDSRCFRCSLQPYCLPDETNFVRLSDESKRKDSKPRSILPLREDGLFLVAQKDGVKIGVRGESLRFTDRNGKVVREIPVANVEEVMLLGGVQISTQAIHTLCANNIPLLYSSSTGRSIAFLDPLDSASAITRRSQILELEKVSRQLALVKTIIITKIKNQRTLLMRNHSNLPSAVPKQFNDIIQTVEKCDGIEEIRGYEGYAAKLYFTYFGELFKSEEGVLFQKNGRARRPPPDPINATLSFGYSMLTHDCTSALRLARLDPAIGALHVPRPGRPALSLDLMEPFRILVADSVAVSTFNRKELSVGHFMQTAAGVVMTEYGRKAFFSAYGRRMETEIRHPFFGYKLSYRRMIALHAKMIAAWFRGEIETLSFLTTR